MGFVQIIEMTTTEIEQIRKLDDEWEAATAGKRTATRSIVTKDRDKPDTYIVIVEFPSYEAAMANNDLPETAKFAGQINALTKSQSFRNLDVLEDNAL